MKRFLFLTILAAAVSFCSACKYAHGDGPDVASPRHHKKQQEQNKKTGKNQRKSNWLNMERNKISSKDINTPGANDEFQVFPIRDRNKRRSEDVRKQSSPFFWR